MLIDPQDGLRTGMTERRLLPMGDVRVYGMGRADYDWPQGRLSHRPAIETPKAGSVQHNNEDLMIIHARGSLC